MSIMLSIAVIGAVLALVVAFASVLVHPHVCTLMQGDWVDADPDVPRVPPAG